MQYVMDNKIVKGVVIEILPAGLYKVSLENGREILCYLGGKMKYNHIRVILNDTVGVVLDPYGGKATNRIVSRD